MITRLYIKHITRLLGQQYSSNYIVFESKGAEQTEGLNNTWQTSQ